MITPNRRDVLKQAFVAPLIITLAAMPSWARAGSNDIADGHPMPPMSQRLEIQPRRHRHLRAWWEWLKFWE
jgi:hypothetical protein